MRILLHAVSVCGLTLLSAFLVSTVAGAELSRCNAFNDAATTWAAVACSDSENPLPLQSLNPSVLLPDGTEFKTWEQPAEHRRTFFVAQNHSKADDSNPGSAELPWKTINRAASILKPGDRVVVKEGCYREWVRPARGGTSALNMITYQAAENQKVIISGSEFFSGPWKASACAGHTEVDNAWMAELPDTLFNGHNPFAKKNVTANMLSNPYLSAKQGWDTKPPYILPQGLVFQDGRRMRQVADYEKLAESEGAYWVEKGGQRLHIRPFDNKDPQEEIFEVTTRPFAFAPEKAGLGFIRIDGFIVERVASSFPMPQHGAISARQGHHWIIQNNIIRQINALGLDYGRRQTFIPYEVPEDTPKLGGVAHIIRHNTFTDCGICSMSGLGTIGMLVEDNHSSGCGWQSCPGLWENAGIKLLYVKHSLIQRNVVQDTINAVGLWIDHSAANARITQNIIVGVRTAKGGIFLEASYIPNMVDHNIVWDCNNAFYQHDCEGLIIANNLFGQCAKKPVLMLPVNRKKKRVLDTETQRLSAVENNRVTGNIFYGFGEGGPDIPKDGNNVSDYNLFVNPPDGKPFNLTAWQKKANRESHSFTCVSRMHFSLVDRTLKQRPLLPRFEVPRLSPITFDFFVFPRPAEATTDVGPFLMQNMKPEMILN